MGNVIDIGLSGGLHLSAEAQIRFGYKKLFLAVQPVREKMRAASPGREPLCHFVSMKGTKYDAQEVKLLLVGRAVNDWGDFDAPDCQAFVQQSMDKLHSRQGFDWVEYDEEKGLHNHVPDEKVYYLNRSAFWRTARRIHAGLSGIDDPRWVEYIAWSDLYKIAPRGGNPGERLCKAQRKACVDILKGEIMFYRPTHILFMTGWDWFEQFKKPYMEYEPLREPFPDIQSYEGEYVEGEGTYLRAKAVVCRHPQGKPETEIVDEVLNEFEKIGVNPVVNR